MRWYAFAFSNVCKNDVLKIYDILGKMQGNCLENFAIYADVIVF